YGQLPDDEAVRIKLAHSCNELGRALRSLQRFDEAERMHARAVQTLTDSGRPPDRPECRYELARTYYLLGQREMLQWGRPPEPGRRGEPPPRPGGPGRDRPGPPDRPGGPRAERLQQAIALLDPLTKEHPSVPEYKHLLACCYRDAPPDRPTRGQGSSGPDRAVEVLRQLVKESPRVPDYQFDLCETLRRPAPPGRPGNPEAKDEARLEEAISRSAELVKQYPNVPQYAAARAQYHDRLGMALAQARNFAEAETVHRKAVSLQAGLVKQYPDVMVYRFWL